MKIRNYVDTLNELSVKKTELEVAISTIASTHAVNLLQREVEDTALNISAIEELEVKVSPQVIRIGFTDIPTIAVGNTHNLDIKYTLTDGTLVNYGTEPKAFALFVDYDGAYNNTGFITSMTAKDYTGDQDLSLTLTRTANDFDVFDSEGTQGLQIVKGDTANKYELVDTKGVKLGVSFTEENTVPGDNFRVLIVREVNTVEVEVADESVATVEGTVLTAVADGTTTVTVRSGSLEKVANLTVGTGTPPVEPEPKPITDNFKSFTASAVDDTVTVVTSFADAFTPELTTETFDSKVSLVTGTIGDEDVINFSIAYDGGTANDFTITGAELKAGKRFSDILGLETPPTLASHTPGDTDTYVIVFSGLTSDVTVKFELLVNDAPIGLSQDVAITIV